MLTCAQGFRWLGAGSMGADRKVTSGPMASLLAVSALALSTAWVAAPAVAGDTCALSGGGNGGASAIGMDAFACGPDANAPGGFATAIGYGATADGFVATASGMGAKAVGLRATATGATAAADGDAATATGAFAIADGESATATGADASASGINATATGQKAHAGGDNATATGQEASANGENATATGQAAYAFGTAATATGQGAIANGDNTAAYGQGARAVGENATAYGQGSTAIGSTAMAIGQGSTASGFGATALGVGTKAEYNNSIAVGAGVETDRVNQVKIGSNTNTYTLAGLNSAASKAEQTQGDLYFVTTDEGGNLATSDFRVSQLTALDGRIDNLGTEIAETRKEARQGIAAAIAMASAPMPSAAGRTTWATNVGYFRGETAFGGALTHRFDTANPFGLSVGYSYGGGKSHAARIGLMGEF